MVYRTKQYPYVRFILFILHTFTVATLFKGSRNMKEILPYIEYIIPLYQTVLKKKKAH